MSEQQLIRPAMTKLSDVLAKRRQTIEKILGRSMNQMRFLSLISAALQQTPQLMQCTPISVLNCVLAAAQMGLEIRRNSAYLVPFTNSRYNRTDCNLLIDYRGKISIAHRSGFVEDIRPLLVYAGDEFDFTEGTGGRFHHRPLVCRTEGGVLVPVPEDARGPVVLAYCVAQLRNTKHIEVMSLAEVEAIHKRARGAFKDGKPKADSPWTTDWNQMARKTTVHRCFNYLPQDEAMAISQEVDDKFEMEVPLDNLIPPEGDDDDEPMVKVGAEEQQRVLEEKLKNGEPIPPNTKKLHSIARKQSRNGVPVMAELPPVDQVTHKQQVWVDDKFYEFDGELNCWVEIEAPQK